MTRELIPGDAYSSGSVRYSRAAAVLSDLQTHTETHTTREQGSTGVAVVIPCHKVTRHIGEIVAEIGPDVDRIYCVDDACPDHSGDFIAANVTDPRVLVLRNGENQGVGGATMAGYRQAVLEGASVIVKIDGNGQMDPRLIGTFVRPILRGGADYTKGNGFLDLKQIRQMPGIQIFGNAVLSIMTKLSTGYWDVFDPTNGCTAIHADVAKLIPYDKVSRRYFFESDLLFRLGTFRAVAVDIPLDARYGDEESGLKVGLIVGEFEMNHLRNIFKRIVYNYLLRDMPLASLQLVVGVILFLSARRLVDGTGGCPRLRRLRLQQVQS